MPNHPNTVSLKKFSGLNNVFFPEDTDSKYLKEAVNIDIDKEGKIHKRKGYQRKLTGNFHSLWSNETNCYAVKDENLISILPNYSYTTIDTGYSTDRLSYETTGDNRVYFTSISKTGIIENNIVRPWGISKVNPQPSLGLTTGFLSKGRYQVALTYVSFDGRESGASLATILDIPVDNSGINITNITSSTDPTVSTIRVYCSTPNGQVLYFNKDISSALTSTQIKDLSNSHFQLNTFNIDIPPKGSIVKYSNGIMYLADKNILWYSEPFSYEWFNYRTNFLQFESDIRSICPVENGLWVGTDKLYWLSGRGPDSLSRSLKENVKVVKGTEQKILGSYLFIQNTPVGYKWIIATNKGLFALYNDGMVLNLSEKNVSMPIADEGSSLFAQTDGINRYISLLKKKDDSTNVAIGDLATAKIIRNGITVP